MIENKLYGENYNIEFKKEIPKRCYRFFKFK